MNRSNLDHIEFLVVNLSSKPLTDQTSVRNLDNFLHSLIPKNNNCMVMTCKIKNNCSIASYIFTWIQKDDQHVHIYQDKTKQI
jgi:hypothetical protein